MAARLWRAVEGALTTSGRSFFCPVPLVQTHQFMNEAISVSRWPIGSANLFTVWGRSGAPLRALLTVRVDI
jgi:hypothetical protein